MTLRTRLTATFLAVVLGPVLLGAVAVGAAATSITRDREGDRLRTAASALTTSVNALCQRARAASEAVAVTATADPLVAARTVVARGLADGVRVEDAAGRVVVRGGRLPGHSAAAPWGDCAATPGSGRSQGGVTSEGVPLVTAVLELRRPDGAYAGRVLAAFVLTRAELRGLAAAAGVGVTLVTGPAAPLSTLAPAHARAAAGAVARTGAAPVEVATAGGALRVRGLGPSGGQPFRFVVSTPAADLGGLYAALAVLVVLVTVVAVLAAGYLARSLTRPLDEVVRAAEMVARGEFGARVPVRDHAEVGRLAATFNRMTREMQAYVAALTASRDQLRGTLATLGDTLSGTHDLHRILEVTLESVVVSTGAEAGVVLLVESGPDGGEGVLAGQRGHGMASRGVDVTALRVAVGDGLLGRVAASGEARLGVVRPGDALLVTNEPECRTYLAVPFFGARRPVRATAGRSAGHGAGEAPGPLLGVLALYDRLGADEFDDGDLVTLRSFTGQAAVAVENVLLHEGAQRTGPDHPTVPRPADTEVVGPRPADTEVVGPSPGGMDAGVPAGVRRVKVRGPVGGSG